jgi:hypothetical protein
MRRASLVAGIVLAGLGVGAAPAVAAPKPGTFAGSLGVKVPRGAEAEVRAVDRATGAVAATGAIGRSGAFRLRLPAGAYTVIGTVVSPRRGAKPVTVVSAVSLKPGQKRAKANLRRKRKKKPKRARAAYVQERGQVTPGSIALEIPDVTGDLSGDFSAVRRGLNDLAVTDLVGGYAKVDCDIAVIEVDRRADVLRELAFQQSPYVDPSTRVQRNFVLGDVEVVGRARQVSADRIEVTYGLRDKRTGADLGSVKGTAGGDRFFEDLERLSQQLADEVCKLSDTYEVTIDVRGQGNFATHAASAAMQATLKARRANRKAQTWTQTGPIVWTTPAIVSKTECVYTAPLVPTVNWTVTLTVAGEDRLKVDWGVDASDMSTASVDCPGDPDPPPIPGQPATALVTTGPASFVLPFAGGVEQLRGEIADGGDGFFNTGTITVKPGPIVRVGD